MDNLNEAQVTADTAEAEKSEAAAVLGKFKDVKTLMKAYSDLEAEFTRRSQRLKELEKENKAASIPDGEGTPPSRADGATKPPSRADGLPITPSQKADGNSDEPTKSSDEEKIAEALTDKKVRDAVIGDYLKGLAENKVPLVAGGGAVTAPRNVPKSVREAGKLAQQFLKGQ